MTDLTIEPRVTATARSVAHALRGEPHRSMRRRGTRRISPVSETRASSGKWAHAAEIGFETSCRRKLRRGASEGKLMLDVLGVGKLKKVT